MSPLRIYGSTSGYTEIAPNSVAPNNTLTLPSTGSSLVSQDASGNISISGILTATNFVGNLTGTATGLTGTPNIVLGIATVSAGTTSAPAITPTGDSNTGIFFPSADTIAFAEGGVEAARFDSSGRLLIGTSTTRTFIGGAIYIPLQVEGANNNYSRGAALTYGIAGTPGPLLCLAKHRSNSVGGSTVVASGDELGGVVFHGSDGTNLLQSASIYSYSDGTPGANDMPGRLVFSTTADGASSPTERMRIASNGNFYWGTTSTTFGTADGIYFAEGGRIFATRSADAAFVGSRLTNDGAVAMWYRGTSFVGNISVTASATAYNTSSDYRLKENIEPVTDGIARLQQLKPSRFNFIVEPAKTVDGFIAHEVQTVVPEAITGEKDAVDGEGNPQYQSIDQSKLVPLLTAALQEAVVKIESLEARLTAAGI